MAKTIFQGLNSFFKKQNSYSSDQLDPAELNFMDKELMRTQDKEEFDTMRLQKQQLKYLKSQWNRISNSVARNTLIYEAQRIPAYFDYDLMSRHDLVGKALEIYTEECTTSNENGKMLLISSESKRVQKTLEGLFYNNLNAHTNVPMWVYETMKNGDCFVHLNLDDTKGIIGCRMLPTVEIERIDSDYLGRYFSGNPNLREETYFRWRTEHLVEFRYWQVAHFRLLLDQTCLPYGVSMLKNIRRLYQNILLVEDALMSEQILRGIDRLAFYIDVGGMDPDDVPQYLQQVMDRVKRKKSVDKVTGQIDLKHHVLSIDSDFIIPKRGQTDTSKIEKIEGKRQMDTGLIDYLVKKLVGSLGVPKSFLNYDDAVGDGKNLSMLDIRFAKTVNRIQQSILMTLNQMAVTHLILLGMEDEVGNFQLAFNNPSIQTEVLRIDLLQSKVNLYRDLTDVGSTGIAAMSHTKAMQKVFGDTNDEIVEDIKKQVFERAVSAELETAPMKIPTTGIFDDVYELYGDPNVDVSQIQQQNSDGESGGFGGSSGGSGGSGSVGGSLGADLGSEEPLGSESPEESEDSLGQDQMEESIEDFVDKLIMESRKSA